MKHQSTIRALIRLLIGLLCLVQVAEAIAAPGDLDTTFAGDGKARAGFGLGLSRGYAVAAQADGKLVVAGEGSVSSTFEIAVVRYNADGSLDASFGDEGSVFVPSGGGGETRATAVKIQTDGKIVVAGYTYSADFQQIIRHEVILIRFNANGSLDTSFDSDGKVTASFGITGENAAYALAIQADGKLVVAGSSGSGSAVDFALARFNADGSLDNPFDGDGLATTSIGATSEEAYGAAIQSDGKILVAGSSYSGPTSGIDFTVVRYNTDGSLDDLFGSGGKAVVDASNGGNDIAYGVALDSAGSAVVAGEANGMFGAIRILGDNPPDCDYSLSPASDYLPARGGSSGFNVNASAGCAWTAQTSDPWLIIVSNTAGSGNGTVSFEARENFTTAARQATITVADQTFTLVQEGTSQACGYSISPQFANYQVGGGSGTISVTTSAGCGWQAVSNQSWIVITSTGVGVGNGTINYTVSANTTGATRTGALLVGGRSLNIKQKGGL